MPTEGGKLNRLARAVATRVAVAGLTSFGGAGVLAIVLVLTVFAALGFAVAMKVTSLACSPGAAGANPAAATAARTGPVPTRAARKQIPADRLALYRAAGSAEQIDWAFLASIGTQECDNRTCPGDNGSGCAGPMQIAMRRGSPCSPGGGPTEWDRFKTDGGHDGRLDVNDPADAIFTAARILRIDKRAPATGGSYAAYRQAACRYYGACTDGVAAYADQVMARAVLFGFQGAGSPAPSDTAGATPVPDRPADAAAPATGVASGGCAPAATDGVGMAGGGALGQRIVQLARGQLGVGERPAGSNCTPYGPCEEWCALFAAWVWQQAGSSLPGAPSRWAYTGDLYTYAETHGHHVLPPTATPAPGDVVLYGSGPGPGESAHVAIVERVLPDRRIVTIDGNSSGDDVSRTGPFDPARAVAAGLPAPVYGYAQPPAATQGSGRA